MNGTSTALVDPTEEALSSSRLLGSSLGSLSSPRKAPSGISKVYKQASDLFLTRRFQEALVTIEPLITAPKPQQEASDDENETKPAPVALASRGSRIKVWSFYLNLLNEISELGPEDGKAAFGNKEWKSLVAKAQDGSVWEEVVNIGYGGNEGNVDADVVIALATLLLAQSPTQKSNQERLETYLSASRNLSQGLTDRFKVADSVNGYTNGSTGHNRGTNTPRDLNTLIQIIELFTLHVLPKNGEWYYARGFISNSEVLDEEVRESFLQTLRSLENEETQGQDQLDNVLTERRDLLNQEPQPAEDSERASIDTIRQQPQISHQRTESETDYGIETSATLPAAPTTKTQPPKSISKPIKAMQPRPPHSSSSNYPRKPPSTGIYKRSLALMSALQHLISNMTEQISRNPMSLLRFVLFLMGLIVALSRRDVKDRLARLTGAGWDKMKRTVGMGVKVSYI